MNALITVGQVLGSKGYDYWSIAADSTAYEALELMANKNVGALLVMEGEHIIGIFSERDYARKVILKGKASRTTSVLDIMSSPPICIEPGKSLNECMVVMRKNHIRHLPVMDHGQLLGIVSINDIIDAMIAAQETTIRDLEDYITGDACIPKSVSR